MYYSVPQGSWMIVFRCSVPWPVCGCRLCMDFLFRNCFCPSHTVAGDWKKTKKGQKSLIAILFLKGRDWLIQLKWLRLDQPITIELQRQMHTVKPYRSAYTSCNWKRIVRRKGEAVRHMVIKFWDDIQSQMDVNGTPLHYWVNDRENKRKLNFIVLSGVLLRMNGVFLMKDRVIIHSYVVCAPRCLCFGRYWGVGVISPRQWSHWIPWSDTRDQLVHLLVGEMLKSDEVMFYFSFLPSLGYLIPFANLEQIGWHTGSVSMLCQA